MACKSCGRAKWREKRLQTNNWNFIVRKMFKPSTPFVNGEWFTFEDNLYTRQWVFVWPLYPVIMFTLVSEWVNEQASNGWAMRIVCQTDQTKANCVQMSYNSFKLDLQVLWRSHIWSVCLCECDAKKMLVSSKSVESVRVCLAVMQRQPSESVIHWTLCENNAIKPFNWSKRAHTAVDALWFEHFYSSIW